MRRFVTFAAIAAFAGISGTASAQIDQGISVHPSNVAFRLGVVLPLDSALADVGNPMFGVGAEYQLERSLLANGDTYISIDYYGKGIQLSKGSVIPLCLNQRFYTGRSAAGRRTYAFVGLGGAIVDVVSSNTVVAARGGVGAELGDAIFFEAAAVVSDRAATARANAVGFYVGYRF